MKPASRRMARRSYRADLTGQELSEVTVSVIGYGHVGTKVVRILKAFGCRTLVCDPYVQLRPKICERVIQVSLETILRESDVVTLHARVTEETRVHRTTTVRADEARGYSVNTARGPLVDYDALTKRLRRGLCAAPRSTPSQSNQPLPA